MPRIKVCGVTDAAFAVAAARRDVDYLGLIFAEGSPRQVTPEKAHEMIKNGECGLFGIKLLNCFDIAKSALEKVVEDTMAEEAAEAEAE